MSTKAIIKLRRPPAVPFEAAVEVASVESTGASVEQHLTDGILVSVGEAEISDLEAQGYRVKTLPDTNLLHVGAYTIDIERDLPEVPNNLEIPGGLRRSWSHNLLCRP